jgi:hypothetical protein
MPITFEIDRSRQLAEVHVTGIVTFEDFVRHFESYADAGPTLRELYDFRGLEDARLSSEDVRTLVQIGKSRSAERVASSKTALLAGDALEFGLYRMYELLGELEGLPWETQVFQSHDDAREWLGLSSES